MRTALGTISMALAAEHAEFDRKDNGAGAESKLRQFFEHFTNVFTKKQLWNERDFKAGAKYGLTTIKPFLAKETKTAQILPMAYQVNPVLSVEEFDADVALDSAEKLLRKHYGPLLKVTLDTVYGVREPAKLEKDSHGVSAIVDFEDAGALMRAKLTISVWNEKMPKSPLAIYVNISRRKA